MKSALGKQLQELMDRPGVRSASSIIAWQLLDLEDGAKGIVPVAFRKVEFESRKKRKKK